MTFLNKIIWFLIIGIRPLFGTIQCKYVVTCTEFARQQLAEQPFIVALEAIIRRFLSCGPWC